MMGKILGVLGLIFVNINVVFANDDFLIGFFNGLSSGLDEYNNYSLEDKIDDLNFTQLLTLGELKLLNQQIYAQQFVQQLERDVEYIDTCLYENFLKNKTPEEVWSREKQGVTYGNKSQE